MRHNPWQRRTVTSLGAVAAMFGVIIGTAAPAGAVLSTTVDNGGFESPAIAPEVFHTYSAGESIGAWQVVDGSVDIIHDRLWRAAEGEQALNLNGNEPGTVQQTVSTLPLTKYVVTFSLAGSPQQQGETTGQVLANGKVIKSFSFDTTGKTEDDMGYVTVRTSFTATGLSTDLAFRGTTPPNANGAVIDDVRIQACLLILCR